MNQRRTKKVSGTFSARWCLTLLFALLASGPGADAVAAAPGPAADWALCGEAAVRAERVLDLPPHLLGAIAKVESGRWHPARRAAFAWPWTVTAEGRGRFLPSRAAAVAWVRTLRSRGLDNIDVGCLQVNLRHHAEAFDSLEAAFEPARNAAYAGRFLKRLRAEAGSWTKAIGLYHSRTPRFNGPYRLKVFRAWRGERHRARRAAATR